MHYIIYHIKSFIRPAISFLKYTFGWLGKTLPASRILGWGALSNKSELKIFVKDLIVPNNTSSEPKLISTEGAMTLIHPNIIKVWSEVEARGASAITNFLGSLGKTEKIKIVEMSSGHADWQGNIIILGAQSGKSLGFYGIMEKVGYRMDEKEIYDYNSNKVIVRENGYGYGLIIKANNKNTSEKNTPCFLLGGFGTLGTEAAIYYFCNHFKELEKKFKKDFFSVVVRAQVNAGAQSVERIKSLDKNFKK